MNARSRIFMAPINKFNPEIAPNCPNYGLIVKKDSETWGPGSLSLGFLVCKDRDNDASGVAVILSGILLCTPHGALLQL